MYDCFNSGNKHPVRTVNMIQSGRFGEYENLLPPPAIEDQTFSSNLYRQAVAENLTEGTAESSRDFDGSSTRKCGKQLALINLT
jgi:hypothetical protein